MKNAKRFLRRSRLSTRRSQRIISLFMVHLLLFGPGFPFAAFAASDNFVDDAAIYLGAPAEKPRPRVLFLIDNSRATEDLASGLPFYPSVEYPHVNGREPWDVFAAKNTGEFATLTLDNTSYAFEDWVGGSCNVGVRDAVREQLINIGLYTSSGTDTAPNIKNGDCSTGPSGNAYALGNYLNYLQFDSWNSTMGCLDDDLDDVCDDDINADEIPDDVCRGYRDDFTTTVPYSTVETLYAAAGGSPPAWLPVGVDVLLYDMDQDGIPNGYPGSPWPAGCDICPGGDDSADVDFDGVPDACDVCSLPPNCPTCSATYSDDTLDLNSDGTPDCLQNDSDGDGVSDGQDQCEGFDDTFDFGGYPGVPDACDPLLIDSDLDGVVDAFDQCPGFDDLLDMDADGLPDGCDPDDDNDSIEDVLDNCSLIANTDQFDTDLDGLGDVCDADLDGDGVANAMDNCPDKWNPDQSDVDGDNWGDACDLDEDNDGINDELDNCPLVANVDQLDLDGDGFGDLCDTDIDADAVPNPIDNCIYMFNPDQIDTDHDGLGDACDPDPLAALQGLNSTPGSDPVFPVAIGAEGAYRPLLRAASSAMPSFTLAVTSFLTFISATGGEAQAAQQTQRKIIYDAISQVVEANRAAVDFGAYSYGTNNRGGHKLFDVQNLENVVDRDAFLAAIPGVDEFGNNTGYPSITSGSVRPLSSALYDAGYYFGAAYAPVHDEGQYINPGPDCGSYSHIIVITNGLPNSDSVSTDIGPEIGDADGDGYADEATGGTADYGAGDHYLDDIAYRLNKLEDINGDGRLGDVTVHTVLAFQPTDPLLERAAVTGGGSYYNANNGQQLVTALSELMNQLAPLEVKIVLEADTSLVAPLVPKTPSNSPAGSDRTYLALFKPQVDQSWVGNIKKYRVGNAGQLFDRNGDPATSAATGDFITSSLSYWGTRDRDLNGTADEIVCSDATLDSLTWRSLADGDGGLANCGGVGGTLTARDLSDTAMGRPVYTGARSLYTYTNSGGGSDRLLTNASNAFDTGNTALHTADDGTPGPLAVEVSSVAAARAEENDIINYVHGYEYGDTSAQRSWLLGDIMHAQPAVVHYSTYLPSQENDCAVNSSVIYAGANDGMLHAFRDCDGREMWGFIPPQILPYLKDSVDGSHQYSVDSSPTTYRFDRNDDGVIDAGDGDRVVLLFGLGRGGGNDDLSSSGPWGGYLAVDVSVPESPELLFFVDSNTAGLAEMGQSWAQPYLAKVRDGSNEKIVAFVPGGYDKNEDLRFGNNQYFPDNVGANPIVPPQMGDAGLDFSGQGNTSAGTTMPDGRYQPRGRAMYAIEIATVNDFGGYVIPDFNNAGSVVWEYDSDNNADLDYPIASEVAGVDVDADGFTDLLYAGDTGGRMWRFNVDSQNSIIWSGSIIFDSNPGYDAGGNQSILPSGQPDVGRKIFYPPAVSVINGKPHLWFGTGDRAHPLNHAVIDRLYQVVDRGQTTAENINESRLVDLTEDPLQTGDQATVIDTFNKLANVVPGPNGETDYYHGWSVKLNWAFPEFAESPESGVESTVVGEKVMAIPQIYNNEVYFSTYAPQVNPAEADPCSVGNIGHSRLYHLNALTGEAVFNYDIYNDADYASLPEESRAKGSDGAVLRRSDRSRLLNGGFASWSIDLVDSDGDGVLNVYDTCPGYDDAIDLDADGIADGCDPDDDGDGLDDAFDNCPQIFNPDQVDTPDADGLGNVCDVDNDQDGLEDITDNCPAVANADQADLDGDSLGDLCDDDDDGDGMSDVWELLYGLNPGDPLDGIEDLDGDGISNADEAAAGTDPGRAGVLPQGYSLPQGIAPLQLVPEEGPVDGQRPLPQ